MVSSAIWEKHAQVSFSKTYKIARVRRTNLCVFEKLMSACFPKFHEKPYYYLIIIYIWKWSRQDNQHQVIMNTLISGRFNRLTISFNYRSFNY